MSINAIQILKVSIMNLKSEALKRNEALKTAKQEVDSITEEIVLLTKRISELENSINLLERANVEAESNSKSKKAKR